MKKLVQEKLKVSQLKGLTVYAENDLYDFACLYLRIEQARGTQRVVRGNTISYSYLTIHGLCSKFASMVDAVKLRVEEVEAVVEKAGIQLGASLDSD